MYPASFSKAAKEPRLSSLTMDMGFALLAGQKTQAVNCFKVEFVRKEF